MNIIPGKEIAARIRDEVKDEVAALKRSPVLNVMLVGNDPASHLYVSLKRRAGEEAGITVNVHELTEETREKDLLNMIESWNNDASVDGILVQIPLPQSNEEKITQSIDPKKDVDGFHPSHLEALKQGEITVVPPVHEGILRLISETPLKLSGAQGVILANSEIFSAPLERLLETAGVSIQVMKPDEIDAEVLKEADLIVIAIGQLEFLKPDMVKDTAVIIDVGTNKTPDGATALASARGGATAGDVDMKQFESTDCWISPVPGGVGPMTIALLLKNVVKLAKESS